MPKSKKSKPKAKPSKKEPRPKVKARPKPKPARKAKKVKMKAAKKAVRKAPKPKKREIVEEREIVVPQRIQESVDALKEEVHEVVEPMEKPTIVFDKVYLQNISFEIASIKQVMERISKQLDKLERQLAEHSD